VAFCLQGIEASKRETLSLSLRLRFARARASTQLFGICQVFIKLSFDVYQVIVQLSFSSMRKMRKADSDGVGSAYGRQIEGHP
jgi:hypothetical protein